jgi:hypothetical protein
MDKTGKIRKGMSVGQLLFGVAFTAAGVIFIGLAYFRNYTLSIRGFLLPQWVFYLVAVFAVILGAVTVFYSFRVWRCASCGDILQYGALMYPADQEGKIIEAIDQSDPSRLEGIPAFTKGDEMLTLSLDFCSRCGSAALVSLTKENRDRKKTVMRRPAYISKEILQAYLAFVKPGVRLDALKIDE